MRTFLCSCGNELFFQSVTCLNCNRDTGMCATCQQVVPMEVQNDGRILCGNEHCGVEVRRCDNGVEHHFCNRLAPAGEDSKKGLCDFCVTTRVIPDLDVAGNIDRWKDLEIAKQRVLYMLDVIGLPFRQRSRFGMPALTFQFKADGVLPVATGHAGGCITINIKEADSVQREITRKRFNEPQRTLVGHFRHELGHYYWERLIKPRAIESFRRRFGNERLNYKAAIGQYYKNGPRPDWSKHFVSAYASMHPWEDFAESFGTWLDMFSVVDTACHFSIIQHDGMNFEAMLETYLRVGVIANEFNRDMGLPDLVPEVFNTVVLEKLKFIHQLAQEVSD